MQKKTINQETYDELIRVMHAATKICGVCSNNRCNTVLCIDQATLTGSNGNKVQIFSKIKEKCHDCKRTFCRKCLIQGARALFCGECYSKDDIGC